MEAFAELRAIQGEHCLVRADVTDVAGVEGGLAEIVAQIRPVDILVLNATCDQPQRPIEEYDGAFG